MLACIRTGRWYAHNFDVCRCCTPPSDLAVVPDFDVTQVDQGSIFGGGY